MEHERLHVVILPFSAQGHLIPALLLADKLAKVGFHVTYVALEHRLQHIKNQALVRGCHGAINFMSLKLNDAPPEILQKCTTGHDSYDLVDWTIEHSHVARDEFLELLQSFKSSPGEQGRFPACIISDSMMSWTQDIANELGIPRLVIYPAAVENLVVDFYVKTLQAQGRIPIRCSSVQGDNSGVVADDLEPLCIPGLEPIHPDNLNSLILDGAEKSLAGFYVGHVLRNHEAAGILCNSFIDLEPVACAAMEDKEINPNAVPFLAVGPLLADSYFGDIGRLCTDENKEECLEWLDEQPAGSVIYVSFGSFARASLEQIRELALGLEASGHGFLWVLRPEESSYETSVFEVLPEGFLARTEGRGFVMQNLAPQLLVLSHPATGGFLTHSGWNSTLESISLGVPMLSMPFFADQKQVCRIVVDRLKLGMELPRDVNGLVHRREVENAIEALMNSGAGEAMRNHAKEYQAAARRAHQATDDNLKAFMMHQVLRQ